MKHIQIAIISFLLVASTLVPSLAYSASLSFIPSSGSYEVGKNFSVGFYVNTAGQVMNASSGTISFPASTLEVVSVSKTGSIFSLWVQDPSFSNTNGTIDFEGVVLNPGFSGTTGKLLTVTFKPKKEGSALVKFNSGSVLANDGLGTNLASTFNSATFSIGPAGAVPIPTAPTGSAPKITSSTHPDSDAWYNQTTATFDWNLPSGVLETRILIGRNSNSTPSVNYTPPISTKTVEDLGEGTYYFSVQHRTTNGWGTIGRFVINIDTKAPDNFEILVDDTDGTPKISFETKDLDSGLSHYEVQVGDEQAVRVDEPSVSGLALTSEIGGEQVVSVTAYDKAGNKVVSSVKVVFDLLDLLKPSITEHPEVITQGDVFSIKGIASPNSFVELIVKRKGDTVLIEKGFTDVSGRFEFTLASELSIGNHIITVVSSAGGDELPSNSVVMTVKPNIYIGFAITFLSYLAIAILVVVGLASFIKIIIYFTNDLMRTMVFLKRGRKKTSEKPIKHPEITKPTLNKKKFF